LDNHLETGPLFTVIGLVTGTGVAFFGVYRMILPTIGKKNDKGNG
jgi:F0F1-type ATP synthase assembly protein I